MSPIPEKNGTLPKTGETYSITKLDAAAIGMVTRLQEHVLNGLQEAAYFLVPKSREQFLHYLEGHGGVMYGLNIGSDHAAQMIAAHSVRPTEDERNRTALRYTLAPGALYTMVQGAFTHPDWRGRGLLELLLNHIYDNHAEYANLVARVVPDNPASWRVFLKCGYVIAAAEADPDDERRVFYLQHLTPAATTEKLVVHRHDFETHQKLCREGWVGNAYDKDRESISFVR